MTEQEYSRRKVGAPTETSEENLISEMTTAVKQHADVSAWQKNRKVSPLLAVITQVHNLPKTPVPAADFNRVRHQILDRIAVPAVAEPASWFATIFPRFVRIGIGAVGTLMIIIALSLGVAVAALQSVPGQTIYPLKKIVENVQLNLAPDDQKASLQLQFADNRINELQQVLDQQQAGKVTAAEAQKIVTQTVKDIQSNTTAAVKSAVKQPKVVTKLANLTLKLQAASIQSEGQVKIELEQAAADTQVSQQAAIKNIQDAGGQPTTTAPTSNNTTTHGKLTAVSETSISIGSAKFLLTKDTQYVNVKATELKIDLIVDIEGQIKDNKIYATKVTLDLIPETSGTQIQTQPPATPAPPDIIVIPVNQ